MTFEFPETGRIAADQEVGYHFCSVLGLITKKQLFAGYAIVLRATGPSKMNLLCCHLQAALRNLLTVEKSGRAICPILSIFPSDFAFPTLMPIMAETTPNSEMIMVFRSGSCEKSPWCAMERRVNNLKIVARSVRKLAMFLFKTQRLNYVIAPFYLGR